MKSVEIIANDSLFEMERAINRAIANNTIKDIKFCVKSIPDGARYYAMIIYE